MVTRFVKALRRVPVENGAAKGRARHAVAVAAPRAVAAGDHELELARSRFAKERNARAGEAAVALVVAVELFPDLGDVFLAVEVVEDFLGDGDLVRREE